MRRLGTAILVALLLVAAFATPSAQRAHAEVSGPCTATVNGHEIGPLSSSDKGDAIKVKQDDTITVVMTSTTGFESHQIDMEIAGFRITLQDKTDGGDTQWSGSADVKDYADYGVGLYKVVGEGTLVGGGTCTGAVLLEVEGNALTSVVGLIALGIFVLGLALLAGSVFGAVNHYNGLRKRIEAWSQEQARRIASGANVPPGELVAGLRDISKPQAPITLWTLAMLPLYVLIGAIPTGGAMPSGGGVASLGPLNLPRMPFRPGLSLVGSVGGMMGTEAVVVLFQQFAISPLTQSNAILGLAAGLALSVIFTTVVKIWGGRHANKAIADAEARFNEAIAQVRREAGLPPAAPGTPGGPPLSPPPPRTPPADDRAGEP